MKTACKQNYITTAFVVTCALAATTTQAQDKPVFDGSFALAANDAASSGGRGAGTEAPDQEADLAKKS
jgi:hypothetical protein